jgi:hypothetical protein
MCKSLSILFLLLFSLFFSSLGCQHAAEGVATDVFDTRADCLSLLLFGPATDDCVCLLDFRIPARQMCDGCPRCAQLAVMFLVFFFFLLTADHVVAGHLARPDSVFFDTGMVAGDDMI